MRAWTLEITGQKLIHETVVNPLIPGQFYPRELRIPRYLRALNRWAAGKPGCCAPGEPGPERAVTEYFLNIIYRG